MKKSKSIDIKSLQLGNVDSWADFAWYYSPERFSRAFAKYGILVEDEDDITYLVNMHKRKGDINGDFKNKDGDSVIFNFMDVLTKEIDVDKNELKKKFLATNDFNLVKRMNSFVARVIPRNGRNLRGHVTVAPAGSGVKITCLDSGVLTTFNYPADGSLDQGQAFANNCKGTVSFQYVPLEYQQQRT